jgi:sphingolipid 4-desaturase/C4-monooxygenase
MSVTSATEAYQRPANSTQVPHSDSSALQADVSHQLPNQGSDVDKFLWTYTEEPHRTRRQAIIKAHPEVTKLCGPEPLTKYLVVLVVGLQIWCSYHLRNTAVLSWRFFLTSYLVGATANQNLFLAIHEISHNLAFRSGLLNRAFAIFANLPIGIPYSAGFRPYHLTHHKSLGVDGLDTDLPTALEAVFLDSLLGKAFFCTFQIVFYALRPVLVYKMPFTNVHYSNVIAQVLFDVCIYRLWGSKALSYFIMSSFLAGSLHPCAAHFIAEHYVFQRTVSTAKQPEGVPTPETYSYYGPLNILTYNVGYHNEHHDFPAVPWTRLPLLHEIAKEFYDPLPYHENWPRVLWDFILDKNVSLWCRVKRAEGGRMVGSWKESEVQN